jgi:integrase
VIGELKTDRSKRIVKVPEEALSVLRQVRLIQARTGLELGNPPGKDAPVFAFPDGRPWSPQGIATLWKRLIRDAGIGHLRIHDLRHTAASQLIARGVPITTVSARLGHSKPTTTLAIYSHAMEGGQDIASKAMRELLKTVSDKSQ